MASSPANTSSRPASCGNEDRRSDISRGPHPLLLSIPFHLSPCFIYSAFHWLVLLQSCPTHPPPYIPIQLAITPRVSCRLDRGGLRGGHLLLIAAISSSASADQRQRGWRPHFISFHSDQKSTNARLMSDRATSDRLIREEVLSDRVMSDMATSDRS